MALLSATQGTPERVWSLLNILSSHQGGMERQSLANWLNPRFLNGSEVSPELPTAVGQTIQAASGLGLIDTSERGVVRLRAERAPEDLLSFADLIHETLRDIDVKEADSVMLEAFAWQVVQTEIHGSTQWIEETPASAFADAADAALTPSESGERRFNSTKLPPWRRWMDLIGLSTTLPSGSEYPYVAPRLERVLLSGILPFNVEIPAAEFIAAVGVHMPYLDDGKLFQAMAKRASLSDLGRSVTRILSSALRELAENKVISLPVRGDSSDNYELAPDPFSKMRSFAGVIIHGAA